MKVANMIRTITYVLIFISIYMASESVSKNNIHEGLRQFLSIGVLPASLLAGIRHIFFGGNIIKGGKFFEFEAGGANLGIAAASMIAFINNMSNQTMGIIFLIYAVYLIMGSIAWLIYKPKDNMLSWIFKFWSISGALLYFSYIALVN